MQASEAWIVGASLSPAGAISSLLALRFFRRDRRFKQRLVKIAGRVVEIGSYDSDGQTMYSPIVEYVVADATYRVTDGTSYGIVRWRVGDPHDVRYDPGDPEIALLNDTTGDRSAMELFGWIGGALLVAGLWMLACAAFGIGPVDS